MYSKRPEQILLSALVAAALLFGMSARPARAGDSNEPASRDVLGRLIPGVAVPSHGVYVVPLLDREHAEQGQRVVPALRSTDLLVKPTDRSRHFSVRNLRSHILFLPAGSIIDVANREHMIMETRVLAPKETLTVKALATESRSDEVVLRPVRFEDAFAPRNLRKDLARTENATTLRRFLDRFEPSLTAARADEAGAPTFEKLDGVLAGSKQALPPSLRDPRVIGFATVINSRVYTVEVFCSHELLTELAPRLLRAHSYKRHALESHGDALGIVRPMSPDPITRARTATSLVRSHLEVLRTKIVFRAEAAEGAVSSWKVASRHANGHLHEFEGRLVHAAIYPHIPYERALFSRDVNPGKRTDSSEPGIEELARRSERGTATEAEQRRLERQAQLRR